MKLSSSNTTFILSFLLALFTKAKAIESWKACSQDSVCQATEEYCDNSACKACSRWEVNPKSLTKPSWCEGPYPTDVTFARDKIFLLTYVRQAGENNDASLCPAFSACVKNCRKEYEVENLDGYRIVFTSTFKDTSDCVCDKLTFEFKPDNDDGYSWQSSSTSFDVGVTSTSLQQNYMNTIDFWTEKLNVGGGFDISCVWEYSIGTISSPVPAPVPVPAPAPTPTPTPSSGNALFRADLFGIVSALTMMSALILA